MNLKILFQALRFACIPTLSALALMFFAFFSIGETIAFISSNNAWAIFIRIVLFIVEVALVWYIYDRDLTEATLKEQIENPITDVGGTYAGSSRELRQIMKDTKYAAEFRIFETASPDIVIVKRTKNEER